MPRELPTGVSAAVSTDSYRACLAVEVGLATPLRITDNPAGITIGGNPYAAGFLEVGETTLDDSPSVSVRLSNVGNEVTAPDLDGTAQGGVIGRTIKIWEVVYDSTGAQLGADTIYSGVVSAFVADSDSAELVGTLAELCTAGMVGLVSSRLCPYRYGGARCNHTTASCDKTFAGCTANGNTARFGGFRTMPTLNTRLQFYLTEWAPGSSRFGTQAAASEPTPPVIRPPRRKLSTFKPVERVPGSKVMIAKKTNL